MTCWISISLHRKHEMDRSFVSHATEIAPYCQYTGFDQKLSLSLWEWKVTMRYWLHPYISTHRWLWQADRLHWWYSLGCLFWTVCVLRVLWNWGYMCVQGWGGSRYSSRGDTRLILQIPGRDGGILFGVHSSGSPLVLLLFPLHASVLEPNLDVSLCEAEGERELHAAWARNVLVEEELFLELEQLRSGVSCPRSLVLLGLYHVRAWNRIRLHEWNLSKVMF